MAHQILQLPEVGQVQQLQGHAGVNLTEYQKYAETTLKSLLDRTKLTKKEARSLVKAFRKDVKHEVKSAKRLTKKPTYYGFDATEETGGPASLEESVALGASPGWSLRVGISL